MKKSFAFLVLLAGLVGGLAAQTSVSDFEITESMHLDTNPTMTLEAASELVIRVQEEANRRMRERDRRFSTSRLIQEKTRMEEQLVSRARRELPDNPSVGSFWFVNMSYYSWDRNRAVLYSIYFFVSQNRQVYHWMFRWEFH